MINTLDKVEIKTVYICDSKYGCGRVLNKSELICVCGLELEMAPMDEVNPNPYTIERTRFLRNYICPHCGSLIYTEKGSLLD